MKTTYTINGVAFKTARKAVKRCDELRKAGEKIATIRVNNEPLLLSELEAQAATERAEVAHNKRQGL